MTTNNLWRRAFAAALFMFVLLATVAAEASDYRVGGNWRTDGEGFAKKGVLRLNLQNQGTLRILSTTQDGIEVLTGYEVRAELTASKLEVEVWEFQDTILLDPPVPIPVFNPTMNDPLKLPSFTIDKMNFAIELTSVHAGTIHLTGFIDVDAVGECEVDASNAIWRVGTPRPDTQDEGSGCNSGLPALLLISFIPIILMQIFRSPLVQKQKK